MVNKQAAAVLAKAEEGIARLATTAASERDYDTAERLLAMARQLAGMSARLAPGSADPHGNGAAIPKSPNGPSPEEGAADAGDEPRFDRDGNDLVKRGNSRSDTKAYEHKAPRAVIDILLGAIRETANKKGEFRTSRVFPLQDPNGREIPVYQGYLVLRWLRQIGLVERVARQRYKVNLEDDLVSFVGTAWDSLQQR